MARFPLKQKDVLILAQSVAKGLALNADVFSSPPVKPEQLKADIAAFRQAHQALEAARAKKAAALEAKDALLAELTDNVKQTLRYAEYITRFDDGKLRLVGWSGRKPKEKRNK